MLSATNLLILANVAAYAFIALHGGPNEGNPYFIAGSLIGQRVIADGEWYRIFTGAFLHGGLWHIAINMFALYQLGTFVENALGPWRMLAIYAISLVGSGLAVVYFDPNQATVGASGAIFGLFGALLAIGVRLGKRGRTLIASTLPILLINLAFTFAVPFISKSGHLGGLASGFAAGLLLFAMQRRRPEPAIVDASTGQTLESEYIEPGEPNPTPHELT